MSGPFRAAPPAYLAPSDEQSLAGLLRWAWKHGVPLIPRGAGTGMPGGNTGPHIIVEIGGPAFSRIGVLRDGPGGTGSIRAGVGATGLEADLAARECAGFIPFLPSSARWCSVGGMVANNAAGARSFRYGAAHAWVEALEGYFAWGEPFRAGPDGRGLEPFDRLHASLAASLPDGGRPLAGGWPKVRKNASGYALDRFVPSGSPTDLLVGSEGTLAVLTAAELRFAPLPAERGVAVRRVSSAAELEDAASMARDAGALSCEFLGRRFLELAGPRLGPRLRGLSRGAFALVILEAAGSPGEVSAQLDAVTRVPGPGSRSVLATRNPAEAGRLWEIRHAASRTIAREAEAGRYSTQFIEDSVVPPGQLARYLVELERILEAARLDAVVFGHAGDANVHVNPLVPTRDADWRARLRKVFDAVTELVAALGGTLSGEHGDGRLRAPALPRIWSPGWIRAFAEVKETLDPKRILNPGVILAREGDGDPLDWLEPRPRAFPQADP